MYRSRTHLHFIQLIPSNDQLHSCVSLAEHLDPVRNLRITSNSNQRPSKWSSHDVDYAPLLRQSGNIDPHRNSGDINKALLSLNALGKCLES